jgi:hypothetical protein
MLNRHLQCCVALRCVALRCVALRYVALRYVTLRYAAVNAKWYGTDFHTPPETTDTEACFFVALLLACFVYSSDTIYR